MKIYLKNLLLISKLKEVKHNQTIESDDKTPSSISNPSSKSLP